MKNTLDLAEITMRTIAETGERVGALGEIFNHLRLDGVEVPDGFVMTASAYRRFMDHNGLADLAMTVLNELDMAALSNLEDVARRATARILAAEMPADLVRDILSARARLLDRCPPGTVLTVQANTVGAGSHGETFALRAAASPKVPDETSLLAACQRCFTVAFAPAVIADRIEKGQFQANTTICASVQRKISGVAEAELPDADVAKLAGWRERISAHFGQSMDIEWIRHEDTGALFIVQAHPFANSAR